MRRQAVEWPTIGLAAVIYGGWGALTWWHAALPWWLLAAGGGWLTAWQSSLQHEIIHGHPTRNRRVNRLLGIWPLALWLPYDRYRAMHLAHHYDERITDPYDDPETFYWAPEQWDRVPSPLRWLFRLNTTFAGRLVLGPPITVAGFLWSELRELIADRPGTRRAWAAYLLPVGLTVTWLTQVCGMGLGLYVLTFVWPGTALILVRSFAEHRAHAQPLQRTAVVEASPVLGLLFLYNNLHAVHHARPALAWYSLPRWYRANRTSVIQANGGLVYRGYGEVARRFLWRSHDRTVHPLGRVPAQPSVAG